MGERYTMGKPTLLLIDGSSYIFRAFFALPPLSNSRGTPTNATLGFTNMLLKMIKEFHPKLLAVAFDARGPSFRNEVYSAYKANRPAMPERLSLQIPYIKQIVEGFKIAILEREGYEADDLIGTIARRAVGEGYPVQVITGDKDIFQLIDTDITTLDTMKNKSFGIKEVRDRFGVEPNQLVDLLALAGDAIDNIPGVPGIGLKTAATLIREFGSLENLLTNVEEVAKSSVREKLIAFADQARLSRQLATIDRDVPLDCRLEDFLFSGEVKEDLKDIFKELEFTKLLRELPASERHQTNYESILTEEDLRRIMTQIESAGAFAISLEPLGFALNDRPMLGIAISVAPFQSWYIPLTQDPQNDISVLPQAVVFRELSPHLKDPSLKKSGFDIKRSDIHLRKDGLETRGWDTDVMLASYLLNPTRHDHGLDTLAEEYLDHRMVSRREIMGSGPKALSPEDLSLDQISQMACEASDVSLQLSRILRPKLEEGGFLDLYQKIELPLIFVLAEMEMKGVKVDLPLLARLSRDFETKLNHLMKDIHNLAGETFNINSPKQLAHILFDKLKLPPIKKTKTGFSTDEEVLNKLAMTHPLPAKIIQYRGLSKLKSTYVDVLPALVNERTGRIHTSFNQTVTATGRLSSSDPNLQNIPIRTEEGRRIRQAFIPEKGWSMLSADYAQIELRILAHLSRDSILTAAFQRGEDIHRRTGAEIYGVPPDKVDDQMRREAKVINFGVIYGMSAFGLAKELGVDTKVAQAYIEEYFVTHRGVKSYIDHIIGEAREKGYVTTLFNRRRYLPEINSSNRPVRQFAERTAINTPIQGTAADLIKMAMIRIHRRLHAEGFSTEMILQVHDELVFEVPDGELSTVKELIRREMEGVMDMSVPLEVAITCGKTWGEAHA
jgi:DNA polymerase-1